MYMYMYICMTIISLVPILAEGKGSLANLVIFFKGMCHRNWHALKCEICEYHFFTMDDQWFYSLTVWIYNKVDKQVKQ